MKYRKKPVVIEATQWFKLGDHPNVVAPSAEQFSRGVPSDCGMIRTLEDSDEGAHIVSPGDWIITGIKGEHYACKPDIFAATYESAE